MNREEVHRMAREAGVLSGYESELFQRFAALVAAAERERRAFEIAECYRCGWDSGVRAEREACAKVCETQLSKLEHTDKPYNNGVRACAAAIRARGEK